jgi:hypothetical protein
VTCSSRVRVAACKRRRTCAVKDRFLSLNVACQVIRYVQLSTSRFKLLTGRSVSLACALECTLRLIDWCSAIAYGLHTSKWMLARLPSGSGDC